MSIATRTGDDGTTGLLYNRRVPKRHPRVESCGAVDELNSAIGLARALAGQDRLNEQFVAIQKDLVTLMGEIAVLPEDLERYERDGFQHITNSQTAKLDAAVASLESQGISYKGWATPGANPAAAAFDVARTTCRRAERRISELIERGDLRNQEILVYLNRLSDVLWLTARALEHS